MSGLAKGTQSLFKNLFINILTLLTMDCNCPAPTALTEITAENCGVDLKQIQRVALQRLGFKFDAAATTPTVPTALADWQALLTASDDTKVVVTPLIGGEPTIDAGDAITNGGGDNSTLNGVEEVEGVNPSLFSCIFKSLSPATEKAMKALMCEKQLNVYLFLQGGRIALLKIVEGEHTGFVARSIFISDRNNAGYGTKDTHDFRFSLVEGWSEDLEIITPNFNPLTDL